MAKKRGLQTSQLTCRADGVSWLQNVFVDARVFTHVIQLFIPNPPLSGDLNCTLEVFTESDFSTRGEAEIFQWPPH